AGRGGLLEGGAAVAVRRAIGGLLDELVNARLRNLLRAGGRRDYRRGPQRQRGGQHPDRSVASHDLSLHYLASPRDGRLRTRSHCSWILFSLTRCSGDTTRRSSRRISLPTLSI